MGLSEMAIKQIEVIRRLSDGGQHRVVVEKARPNGDVIVSARGRFYLIDTSGDCWKDDRI